MPHLAVIFVMMLAATLLPATAAASEPADAIRYPYVAGLSRQAADGHRVFFCSGALVAPRWILTAAHCFYNPAGAPIAGGARVAGAAEQGGDLWVEVGRDRLRAVTEDAHMRIENVFIHPGYDRRSQANDLALVWLDQIAGPLIADISGDGRPEPASATVLGFGSLYEGRLAANARFASGAPSSQASDRLRRGRVRLVDGEACKAAFGPEGDRGDTLCGVAGPAEACVGDSGGPLVVEAAEGDDRLIGIVSFGSGCAVAAPFVVYTRVDPYAAWIAETIQQVEDPLE